MPTAAKINTLTNYAQGFAQNLKGSLADFIAPRVNVTLATGQYAIYSDKNAFQSVNTVRALGGKAVRLNFGSTPGQYSCLPNALEIPVDDHERVEAGDSIEEAKAATLIGTAYTSREDRVFTALRASVTAQSGKGVWSSASVDPIAELDEQILGIAEATGQVPNRIALGIGAWNILRNHAKVIARQPGAQIIGINASQLSAMLMFPEIEVRIGVMTKDTAKFGVAKSATNLIGAEAWVFIGNSSPNQYDASFAKTFGTGRGGVDAVSRYRDDSCSSEILKVDWSEDVRVTAPIAGRRLTLS